MAKTKVRKEKTSAPVWTAENLSKAEELAGKDADDYGFAFETVEAFSEAPLEFEEYAASLMEDLSSAYGVTTVFNRFSPNYIAACSLMEKIIRKLGSCCVTKAVLEQEGFTFTRLDDLSVEALYCCVSFNFRKCHAALKEGREKHIADFKLLDLECRLYELADRLRSTGDKVRMIREGKIKTESILAQHTVFSRRTSGTRPAGQLSADRSAASMPVMGSVAREMIRQRKAEIDAMFPKDPGRRGFRAVRKFPAAKPFDPAGPKQWMEASGPMLGPVAEAIENVRACEPEPEDDSFELTDEEIERSSREFFERAKAELDRQIGRIPAEKADPETKLSVHPQMKKKKKQKKR